MFKSRKEARTGRNDSVETIRRQAQYRLAGAAMLVSVAVVSFSLLFDTEPRTLGVEMPIAIPTKDKVQPVVGKQVAQAEAKSGAPSSEGVIDEDSAEASAQAAAKLAAQAAQAAQAARASQEKQAAAKLAADKAVAEQAAKQQVAQVTANAENTRAQSILDGNAASAAPAASAKPPRFDYPDDGRRRVIQVGAFVENSRARALRQRLLRNGIETLVNVATVKGERLIRIRVGPFTKAAELQTYIDKIKALGLDARVLTY
ncbi:SPOR domain-containing protein [Burkholderiaceae bacterium]|nr:SPOR domain-containing protein [Burkholderiaceae bacterium]MDB9844996.1 SPOR domain-containing protein [Burkholderiaceae bacterium]